MSGDANPNEWDREQERLAKLEKRRDELIDALGWLDVADAVMRAQRDDFQKLVEAHDTQDGYLALRVLDDILFRWAVEKAEEEE